MAATNRYKLKPGIQDWGGGNRLNGIKYNTISIEPTMFIDSGSLAELSSFANCGFYNGSGCTGSKISDSRIDITPTSSPFSFTLTNLGSDEVIYGFGLDALGENNISVSLVKYTIAETVNNIKGLCISGNVNTMSPRRPNGAAPYRLGSFRGYCHNATDGLNIYAPNSMTVPNNTAYSLYGCATKNQQGYASVKMEIFKDSVSVGSVTKNLNTYSYIEKTVTGTYTGYNTVSSTIAVVCSYLADDNTTWVEIGRKTSTATFLGQSAIVNLRYLTIQTVVTRLSCTYECVNNSAGTLTFVIRVQNVTKSSGWIQTSGSAVATLSSSVFTNLLQMGITNEVGDYFEAEFSVNAGSTWTTMNIEFAKTLNYDYTQ